MNHRSISITKVMQQQTVKTLQIKYDQLSQIDRNYQQYYQQSYVVKHCVIKNTYQASPISIKWKNELQ